MNQVSKQIEVVKKLEAIREQFQEDLKIAQGQKDLYLQECSTAPYGKKIIKGFLYGYNLASMETKALLVFQAENYAVIEKLIS